MTRSVSAWHLRRARLEDAAEIARLVTELGYPVEAGAILPRLQALLVHPDHLVTVAAGPNDRLSGVIMAEHRVLLLYGPQVEIMGLSVGSDVRRMGVGRALVKAVEAWARQFGDRPDRRSLECRPPRITSFLREDWLRAQEDTARLRQVVRQTRQRLRASPSERGAVR